MNLPQPHLIDLGGGLRLVHIHQQDVGAGIFGFVVGAGSADDGDKPGLAHLVEHTIFKGTTHRSAWHINNRMETVGGELNAFTTKEDTTVYSIFPAGNEARAIELLADLAIYSVFPGNEFDKEREVVCDEICSYRDIPAEAVYDDFEDMVFDGTPLGHNILGESSSVGSLSPNDCRQFVRSYYTRTNLVLFYSGSQTPERTAREAAKRFAELPLGNVSAAVHSDIFTHERRTVPVENMHQTHVMLGAPIGSLYGPERFGEKLFANIIGGPGMNSLLNIELRERRGLVYTVEATASHYRSTGLLNIYFGCDAKDFERCLKTAETLMKHIASREDAQLNRSLERAKRQYLGQLAIACENRENRVMDAARHVLYLGTPAAPGMAQDAIRNTTVSQIKKLAEILADPAMLVYIPSDN